MLKLLPSVLSADFANLERDLACIKEAGVTQIHVDVMDGNFVPSISLGFPVIRSMRKVSDLFFDVHLMVEEPGRYLEETKAAGADRIGVHAEACYHLHRTLQQMKIHVIHLVWIHIEYACMGTFGRYFHWQRHRGKSAADDPGPVVNTECIDTTIIGTTASSNNSYR